MSDKSKLSYYFKRKSDTPLQESNNTCFNATTNSNIVNINEALELDEADEALVLGEADDAPPCSSATSIHHDRNENSENFIDGDLSIASSSLAGGCEPLINCLENDIFKRDPGRGPAAAKNSYY